jgi:VanZ family protein
MTHDNLDKPSFYHQLWIALRLLAPVLWAGVILWLSLTSTPPDIPEPLAWDKLQHAGAYGLLTLLLVQMLPCVSRIPQGRTWLLAGLAAVGYGGLMEFLQWFAQSGRSAEWADLAADAVGPLLCYVIFRHKGVAPLSKNAHPEDRHG